MIRSNLTRAKIRSNQRLPCCALRTFHQEKIPKVIQTKLDKLSDLKSTRSASIIPKLHSSQFISQDVADNSSVISYEKAQLILEQNGILANGDSPFRLVLLKFLELELLKISVLKFDELKELVQLITKIRSNFKKFPSLIKYFEKHLSNTAIPIFYFIYNPKYIVAFMNKEIQLLLLDEVTTNNEKMNQIYELLKISSEVIEQFEEQGLEHDNLLIIHYRNAREILKILDRSDYLEFYIKLLEFGCSTASSNSINEIRHALSHGEPHEQEVFEFAAIFTHADKETVDFLKRKMLTFYSFDMIKQIVVKYIQKGEPEKVEFYMEYLLTKYALDKDKLGHHDQKILTSKLYEVLTYHAVRLKNYESAIGLLETVKNNGIEISPKLLHILATSFRQKKMFDAVLVVLRKAAEMMEYQNVGNFYKNMIIGELLITLRAKFPDNPKVLISQFISIFPGSEIMLNQLGLLSLIYNGTVDEIGNLNNNLPVSKSEVSDFIKITDGYPTIENMTELYITVLNHIGLHKHKYSSEFVFNELFNKFKDYVVQVQEANIPNHPFSKDKMDEGIVNVFVRRTIEDLKNPSLATAFLKSFLQTCDFRRFDGRAASMILYFNRDNAEHYELDELITIMGKLHAPLGFYAITAMILRHDKRMNYEDAYEWYKKLLALGKSITHFDLIQVIKKHGWELPEDFDHSLLKLQYMNLQDRREIEFEQDNDEVVINDPEFVQNLSATLDEVVTK